MMINRLSNSLISEGMFKHVVIDDAEDSKALEIFQDGMGNLRQNSIPKGVDLENM